MGGTDGVSAFEGRWQIVACLGLAYESTTELSLDSPSHPRSTKQNCRLTFPLVRQQPRMALH